MLIEDDILDFLWKQCSLEGILLRIIHSRLWDILTLLHCEIGRASCRERVFAQTDSPEDNLKLAEG